MNAVLGATAGLPSSATDTVRPFGCRAHARRGHVTRPRAHTAWPCWRGHGTQPFGLRGLLLGIVLMAPAAAEEPDSLTVLTRDGSRATLRGQILDATAESVRILLPGGREQVVAADKIVEVKTQYTPAHVQADEAARGGKLDQALVLHQKALESETRRWVRRRILEAMVWCHRGLGQTVPAGDTSLVLMRDNPRAADYACLPLAWIPAEPTPELEQAARRWLAQSDLPAAVLLGASHLLTTDRPAALGALQRLAAQTDGPLARLAAAQIWRTELLTVDAARAAAWRRAIEEMDEPLRAGPYYLLGQALARQQDWQGAALAVLRVPILYPREQSLSAAALWDAGRAMEKLGRPADAARLYRELLQTQPRAPQAAEAQGRLEDLGRPAGEKNSGGNRG